MIRDVQKAFFGGLMHDLTVLLDIDPRVGLVRSARRVGASIIDEGRLAALDLDAGVRRTWCD